MIARSILVRVEPAAAFRAWTEHIGAWWPPGHRVSGDPEGRVQLEPRPGGRFYERTPDGREIDYGEVLVWEPPSRLRYAWFLGSDRAHPTEVEVRFAAAEGGTRVEVTHRAGAMPPSGYERTAPRFEAGWSAVLASLAEHLNH